MNKDFGLFRLMDREQKERIGVKFEVIFSDLYDSLEETQHDVRDLERELGRIFYGEHCSKTADLDPECERLVT